MSIGAVGSDANYYRTNDKQGRKTQSCGLGDFSNAVQNFKETNQLTAEELKEDKDWRDMSSDEWDKTLEGVDEYIDAAKAAQDMEKMAMSKLQEIQLMDQTTKGSSQSENLTEYVSVEEDENEEKIWTVTSFGEDGIISTRCQNGKILDSWNIKYDNPDNAKKVWDYLAKFKNDDELEFAGSKDFWMEFLSDNMVEL